MKNIEVLQGRGKEPIPNLYTAVLKAIATLTGLTKKKNEKNIEEIISSTSNNINIMTNLSAIEKRRDQLIITDLQKTKPQISTLILWKGSPYSLRR